MFFAYKTVIGSPCVCDLFVSKVTKITRYMDVCFWWSFFGTFSLYVYRFIQKHIHKQLIYDLVPKGAHARGYALQLKIKHCWKLFLFKMLCCVLAWMNEYIYSTDNFSNQALVDFKIQSSHTEKAQKNDRQNRTSMYRMIVVTLFTNKSQAHGEPITDLYAKNIVLYG